MAVTSGFFNSLNGDRKYNAEQMSSLFDGIINDGIFSNIGSAFMVTADSANTINIGIGRAWFDSTWVNNDAILPLTLDGPEVILDRIDAIVIEINKTEAIREGRIVVVKGSPSSSASRPELANADGIYQHPLAYIYRKAGSTAITQADITNVIGTSECPYITGILQVQDIDKNVAQWQSQFEIWFDGLQAILDDDVAANLAGSVMDLDNRFEDLARDRAVYEPLQDDSNDTILDSNGQPILGSTMFGYQSAVAGELISEEGVVETDSFEVGDIITTARSTPGAEWLPCDGSVVNRSDYPKLSEVITDPWVFDKTSIELGSFIRINKMKFVNGYYMILVYDNYFYYSANLTGPWTKCTVNPTIEDNESFKVTDIIYADGKYVVSANARYTRYSNPRDSIVIAYASSLNGQWSGKMLDNSSDDFGTSGVAYGGGYFAVLYWIPTNSTNSYRVCYSTSVNGTFTNTDNIYSVYATRSNKVIQFDYIDGKFVLLMSDTDVDSYDNLSLSYINGAPSGEWTTKNLYQKTDDKSFSATNIVSNGDEYFIVSIYNGEDDSMKSLVRIHHSNTIDGTWSSEEYVIQKDCDRYHSRYYSVSTGYGYYLFINNGKLTMFVIRTDETFSNYYSDSSQNEVSFYGISKIEIENGVGVKEEIINYDDIYSSNGLIAISNGDDFAYSYSYSGMNEFDNATYIHCVNHEKMRLPSIETSGAKAFIKALE